MNDVFQFQTKIANPLFDERMSVVGKTLSYGNSRAEYALKKKFLDKTQHDLFKGHLATLAKNNDLETLQENVLAVDRHIAGKWLESLLNREIVNAATAKATMDRITASKSCKDIRGLMEPHFNALKVAKAQQIIEKAKTEAKIDKAVKAEAKSHPSPVKGKGKSKKGAAEMASTSDKATQTFGTPVLS